MTQLPEIRRYNILINKLLNAPASSEEEKKIAYMLASHCSVMARRITTLEDKVNYLTRKHKGSPKPQRFESKGLFIAMKQALSKYRDM